MSEPDVCANCGEFYEHHMQTTQCYPDSPERWFPRKLAQAICDHKIVDARNVCTECGLRSEPAGKETK